jgi:hypothetical protein
MSILASGLIWTEGGSAEATIGRTRVLASAKLSPERLPRFHSIPATLHMGFRSLPVEGVTPELTRIELKVHRQVTLQARGLPSCSFAELQADRASACAKSLVGHGSVTSVVTLPGGGSVVVNGRLRAFYALSEGRTRILAQVTAQEPVHLSYVIPFTIRRADGVSFGTDIFVPPERMRSIVHGRISMFRMSLHRLFRREGRRESFVSARCYTPRGFSRRTFSLLEVRLGLDPLSVPGSPCLSSLCALAGEATFKASSSSTCTVAQ